MSDKIAPILSASESSRDVKAILPDHPEEEEETLQKKSQISQVLAGGLGMFADGYQVSDRSLR